MKVQIYTMQSVEEALQVAALGVDHLGLTPSQIGLPGEIDFWTAREIVEAVDDAAVCVALTVETEEKEIIRMARAVQPDILHLCSLVNTFPPDDVRRLRDKLPDLPLMQAISVTGPEALQAAHAYQGVADYLILDTQAPDIAGIGASGETHDWNVSREIVREAGLPVILAGGLSPENVARAIAEVDPWGVDSLTHTNQTLPGGGFKKDLGKIKDFIRAARGSG
ncbi:MAG TPA: phosphoribosylanthranilate isomerase [Chloroflexi bacterium]|nr:MAG: phosphoribosylanthranilate isomerase [Chloroflexota bacterium]HDD55530.1 phosphoribosylanthranilate isomerase [Chloroflexota bacterium]